MGEGVAKLNRKDDAGYLEMGFVRKRCSSIVPHYLRHEPEGNVVPFIYFRVPDGASLEPEHKCPQSRKEDTEALSSETAG